MRGLRAQRRPRRKSGLDVFIRHHYVRGAGAFVVQRKSIVRDYKGLTPEARAPYEAEAEEENTRDQNGRKRPIREALAERSPWSRRLRQHAAKQAFRAVRNDRIWEAGAGMAEYGLGMKPQFIDVKKSNKEVHGEFMEQFKFNVAGMLNPPGRLSIPPPCSKRWGGLCRKDPLCALCTSAVGHIYANLRQNALIKKLPLFASLWFGPDPPTFFFIGRCFGKGENIVVIMATQERDDAGRARAAVIYDETENIVCCQAHCAVRKLVNDAARTRDIEPDPEDEAFRYLQLSVKHTKPLATDTRFWPLVSEEALAVDMDLHTPPPDSGQGPPAPVEMKFGFSFTPAASGSDGLAENAPAAQADDEEPHLQEREAEEQDMEAVLSDAEGGGEENPAPVPKRKADKLPAAELRQLAIGLVTYDRAPSSASTCVACQQKITKGALRFSVLYKKYTAYRDLKRLHDECIRSAPGASREQDVQQLEAWLGNADAAEREPLQKALGILQAGAGGSGSAAASSH